MDRRIYNTRSRLLNALLELNAEKQFEAISVKDIATRAGVGRSTFYAHFENKEQLLLSKQSELFLSLGERAEKRTFSTLIKEMFNHLAEHNHIVSSIISDESGNIMLKRFNAIVESFFEYETRKVIVKKEMIQLIAKSCSSSIEGLIISWIEGGQQINKDNVIDKAIRIFELHKNLLTDKSPIEQ